MASYDPLLVWMRKRPLPFLLRITSHAGTQHEVQISGARYERVAETVRALDANTIEALNGEKQVVRAIRLEELLEDDGTADPAKDAPPASSFVPPLPPMGNASEIDAETRRYMVFAHYLATAYSHSNEVAFGQLAEMVSGMQQRSQQTERDRDAIYEARIKQLEAQIRSLNATPVPEAAAGGMDPVAQMMLAQFMQGMNASNGAAGAAGAQATEPEGED